MILLQLFISFFLIGLLSFGGGYAAMPLIQNQVVEIHGWLSMTEFTDLITIAEMTPGPIAINAATFVGTRIGGLPGALIATLGCVLPSFFIVLSLARFYFKYRNLSIVKGILEGLRPAIIAMIASAGLSILILAIWGEQGITTNLWDIDILALFLFLSGLFILRKWKPSAIIVMLGCGFIGIIASLLGFY